MADCRSIMLNSNVLRESGHTGVPKIPVAPGNPIRNRSPEHVVCCVSASVLRWSPNRLTGNRNKIPCMLTGETGFLWQIS